MLNTGDWTRYLSGRFTLLLSTSHDTVVSAIPYASIARQSATESGSGRLSGFWKPGVVSHSPFASGKKTCLSRGMVTLPSSERCVRDR